MHKTVEYIVRNNFYSLHLIGSRKENQQAINI